MSMYLIMSFKIHEANLIKSNEETAKSLSTFGYLIFLSQ